MPGLHLTTLKAALGPRRGSGGPTAREKEIRIRLRAQGTWVDAMDLAEELFGELGEKPKQEHQENLELFGGLREVEVPRTIAGASGRQLHRSAERKRGTVTTADIF